MKTAHAITLSILLLAAGNLSAAAPAEPPTPKPEANADAKPEAEARAAGEAAQELADQLNLSLPPLAIGIPTPMQEYGLTIGDITVTRVRNPLGQLALNKHLMLSRQLSRVTNPWEELAPGTALVLDGKKAVIVNIDPTEAPKNVEATNMRVTVTAKEIGGPEMKLIWQQELKNLNQRVEVDYRRQIEGRVKRDLRVGSHLILEGNRVIVTALHLTTPTEPNLPHTLRIKYSGISSPHGQLTGEENRDTSSMEPTWLFNHLPAQGGADAQSQSMAHETVRMVTWSFVKRTVNGQPDPGDGKPGLVILHRRRGLVTRLEAPVDDPNVARVEAQFSFDGRVLTRSFDWHLSRNASRQVLWQLKPHPSESFVEMYAVNDPNIRFQITPTSLIEANEKAMASLKSAPNATHAPLNLGNISSFTTNSVEQQLRTLDRVYKSDASQVIKAAAKRQTVIKLAQGYELRAIHFQSLANEQRLRAGKELAAARRLELNAWANARKAEFLKDRLSDEERARQEQGVDVADPKDLELTLHTIAEADRAVADYQSAAETKTDSSVSEDYARFFRQAHVQRKRAEALRATARKRTDSENKNSTIANDAEATKHYLHSLDLWQEYILRVEGLAKEERGLMDRGLVNSPLPPDPLIPEILLRQGWIYRQLGQPEEAVKLFYDVLASSLQQKVDNLVRLKRVNLVAKSQIANAFYEDPQELEDHEEAVEKLKNIMVQPPGQRVEDHELDLEQIQLRHMRALYQTIRAIDRNITRDNRRLKRLKISSLNFVNLQGKVTRLAKDRNKHWGSLADHSAQFIERYTRTQARQNVRYDGEVRYYKILAHQALGNEQHVQREVEVLLQNSSVTSELEMVWADTRLQIVMDIANLIYGEAINLQTDLERLARQAPASANLTQTGNRISSNNPGAPVDPAAQAHLNLQAAVQTHLNAAITYYRWAQQRDQSFRSQIFLRQQLAFCHERLGQKLIALDYYNQILNLFEMHPGEDVPFSDANLNKITPALKLVKHLTLFRRDNLQLEIEQLNKSSQP